LTVCHTYGSRRWKVFSFSCWNYFSFFKLFFLLKISFSQLDRFCFFKKNVTLHLLPVVKMRRYGEGGVVGGEIIDWLMTHTLRELLYSYPGVCVCVFLSSSALTNLDQYHLYTPLHRRV
jgi:hypothetical protein